MQVYHSPAIGMNPGSMADLTADLTAAYSTGQQVGLLTGLQNSLGFERAANQTALKALGDNIDSKDALIKQKETEVQITQENGRLRLELEMAKKAGSSSSPSISGISKKIDQLMERTDIVLEEQNKGFKHVDSQIFALSAKKAPLPPRTPSQPPITPRMIFSPNNMDAENQQPPTSTRNQQCQGTTLKGQQCKKRATNGALFCSKHKNQA